MTFPINKVSMAGRQAWVESGRTGGNFAECFGHNFPHFNSSASKLFANILLTGHINTLMVGFTCEIGETKKLGQDMKIAITSLFFNRIEIFKQISAFRNLSILCTEIG